MRKEDNVDMEVKVDDEEMSKIGNYKVKIMIMDQCSVDIVKDLDIESYCWKKTRWTRKYS